MPQKVHVESAYYPPGWDRERLQSAPSSDLTALPTEEFRKLSEGVKEVLGAAGWNTYLNVLVQNEREAANPEPASEPAPPPPFMEVLSKYYPSKPWGFVVYRTAMCTSTEWAEYHRRFFKLIEAQFSPYIDLPGVAEAKDLFAISWEEGQSLAGQSSEQVAREYGAHVTTNSPPSGTKQTLCLNVNSDALRSLIEAPLPLENRTPARPGAPYLQAIRPLFSERSEHDEDSGIPVYFNVAVEAIVKDLFPLIGSQIIAPVELIAECKEDEVWFATGLVGKLT